MFSPIVIPAYYHWLMAGTVIAVLLLGTGCSIMWGFRGLVGAYSTVAAVFIFRALTVHVPLVPGPLLIPPVLLILCFFAVVSWTAAVLLRPSVVRLCARVKGA
jgi:hypothetical protein